MGVTLAEVCARVLLEVAVKIERSAPGELVALADGEYAGSLYYKAHRPHANPIGHEWIPCHYTERQPHVFVSAIEVEEPYRRQGIGRALVAKATARHPGKTIVWSHPTSPDGQALAAAVGGGWIDHPWDGHPAGEEGEL